MKRTSVVVSVNVLIMMAIVVFVVLYSRIESENSFKRQVEHFEDTTVTMERVTENYLEGEQRICDIWAHYVMSQDMTMEEAAAFIRSSHVLENTSAHIISTETRTGLSTRPKQGTDDDYEVSYNRVGLLDDVSWIDELGESINITRAYTNPMNGEQSLAFCNRIDLFDPATDGYEPAVLLRVMPIAELEQKWVFPQTELSNADLAMIDANGDYILKGSSFKNSSLFEFYKSYNKTDPESSAELFGRITSETGSVPMLDSHRQDCILAFTPVSASAGWTLLGLVPAADLNVETENWQLIGFVSAGLLVLFLFDLSYVLYFNKRLQIAAKEAESANRAKTDFLSTMSHDIRTPMNAIIGLTTIAERNLGDEASTAESLRKIGLASNHLLTLINDILDISKVESGKLKLSPMDFSIVDTVENLVTISQPMVKDKDIDFDFHVNAFAYETLFADQLRLNQIYINILSNAIKYTEPGGSVHVSLTEEPSEAPGCVRLTYVVADTGMGMSEEFMATMYQPFSRQVDSRVNSIQGTGLGLAITKQMVDLLEGTIDCQSELGRGTTFTVVLDIPVADRQREHLELGALEVLVVDDDQTMLETTADCLVSLGATVEQARGGTEALALVEDRHRAKDDFDVVVVDWRMPDLDGVETTRRIRAEVGATSPLVLLSAYDWSDIEDAAKEAGATGFVGRPPFRSTLFDRISELMGSETGAAEQADDFADLQGMRILVAEDNDMNWEIISVMLSMYGIVCDRAENGRICVDMMRAAPKGAWELIFMDVQMPEMNGLDATRAIRALPDPWASSIPIVAMTADAFSENVTECLNAGMNGHIAKPVNIDLVIMEIRKIREGSKK